MTKSIDAAEANHREAKKNSRRSVSLHRNDDVKSNASDGRDERSNRRYLMHLVRALFPDSSIIIFGR